ncbi:hypothetical protein CN918_28525 [Priestia megaterium]|nr:hypothetical protein CN918_28525 [Priestia megaterium]
MAKKVVMFVIAFALVISAIGIIPSKNSAEAAVIDPNNPDTITVESLEAELKERAKTDSTAKSALEAYQKLSLTKKQKLVGYLKNKDVLEALLKQSSESTTNEVETLYNGDVKIVTSAEDKSEEVTGTSTASSTVTASSKMTASAARKQYITTSYITHTQVVFGIPITKLTTWVRYKRDGKNILAVYNAGAYARNFNPGVSVDDKTGKPWRTSTRAYARTVWKGYAVFKGFGVRIDKVQTVWGMPNGRGTGTIKLA